MTETRMSAHADVASAVPANGPASARATAVQASNDWWQQHDQRVYACIKLWIEQWWEPQRRVLIDAVGEVFGQERHNRREVIAKIKERVIRLETTSNFEERFTKLAHEVRRGSETPQGELQEKFEALQRQVGELKSAAELDGCFRELAERVGALEQTTSVEARLAELAHEAERRSELLQSGLLPRIDRLERQIDDLTRVADLDARFCELIERVGALEKTTDLEARFTRLANEAKGGSEIQQGERLARIEGLQRQVD